MKQVIIIIFFLPSFLCFTQEKKDTTIIKIKMKEVTISATKTSKSIDELPIPVTIISEKEIKERLSKLEKHVPLYKTGVLGKYTKYVFINSGH